MRPRPNDVAFLSFSACLLEVLDIVEGYRMEKDEFSLSVKGVFHPLKYT